MWRSKKYCVHMTFSAIVTGLACTVSPSNQCLAMDTDQPTPVSPLRPLDTNALKLNAAMKAARKLAAHGTQTYETKNCEYERPKISNYAQLFSRFFRLRRVPLYKYLTT